MEKITHSTLVDSLAYRQDSGNFFWKQKKNGVKPNKAAGCLTKNGYITIRVNGHSFLAHRLAWMYVYGDMPQGVIDHINRIKTDNRISNLRHVTQVENGKNRKLRLGNTSGANGVRFCGDGRKNPWNARVTHQKKDLSLGHFKTLEEAIQARTNWDNGFWNAIA